MMREQAYKQKKTAILFLILSRASCGRLVYPFSQLDETFSLGSLAGVQGRIFRAGTIQVAMAGCLFLCRPALLLKRLLAGQRLGLPSLCRGCLDTGACALVLKVGQFRCRCLQL